MSHSVSSGGNAYRCDHGKEQIDAFLERQNQSRCKGYHDEHVKDCGVWHDREKQDDRATASPSTSGGLIVLVENLLAKLQREFN
jgi:hypothetical protein